MPAARPRPALIGPYGPAQIACLRSWRRLGLDPLFLHIGERPLAFASRIAAATMTLPPHRVGTPEGAASVVAFLNEAQADGISCLAEALAYWLHRLARRPDWPSGVELWLPDEAALDRLASKAVQVDLARASGLNVLPSFLVRRETVADVPGDAFPLVLRPDDPATVSPVFKAALIPNRMALTSGVRALHRLDRPLVAQRLVRGPNLVVHGARTPEGAVFALSAFRADRKFEGVTLRLRDALLTPDMAAACARFADAIGVTGCFHFEFIEDEDGRPWFLEMNGRLGGTTAKVFALGYDEPRHLLSAFVPDLRDHHLSTGAGCVVGRQALLKAALRRMQGRQDPLDYPAHGMVRTVVETAWGLVAWREETYRLGYPLTTLAYLLDRALPRRSPGGPPRDVAVPVREETPP